MTVTQILRFVGTMVSGVAFGAIFASGWFGPSPDMSLTPDAAHGLIYPCFPKGVPWYYSAYTVTKSWDFVVFMLVFVVGHIIAWRPENANSRKWPYNRPETAVFVLSCALGIVFVGLGGEQPIVEWVMAHGIQPPALSCFPMFSGK